MGRDRDPFDRTLEALRRRLEAGPLLQGAALPVNLVAADLAVSPTPVREALAWLAGEGQVARTACGYAGLSYDRQGLADLYALAGLLAKAALDAREFGASGAGRDAARGEDASPAPAAADPADGAAAHEGDPPLGDGQDPLAALVAATPSDALAKALDGVRRRLAPFAAAEAAVLGDEETAALCRAIASGAGRRVLAPALRRRYARRARHAGEILARALGLS